MGIASFVIGLTCLVLSPFLSVFLILPSILALILGIVDTVIKAKKNEPKGLSIAGIVLSTIALAVCILIVVLAVYVFDTVSDTITDVVTSNHEDTTITVKIDEPANLDDVKVTLISVEKNFKDYYDFASVDDDCKIIKATFEFENVGDYSQYISYSDFECFADKFSCDNFYSVKDAYFYETIKPGKKAKGSIYFEIPKDAETVEIEFDSISYDDSKIVFEIDLD